MFSIIKHYFIVVIISYALQKDIFKILNTHKFK